MATVNVKITGDLGVKAVSEAWITINGEDITETGDYTYSGKTEFYVEAGHELGGNACLFYHNGNSVGSVVEEYKAYSFTVEHESSSDVAIVLTQTTSEVTVEITETTEPANPMAPHDGHNTNIGNVAREIESGTVSIGGVSVEIESGLVLVGGVAREIVFGDQIVSVAIVFSGTAVKQSAKVTIDGVSYKSSAAIEVPSGTTILVTASTIYLDGSSVATEINADVTYEHIVEGDIEVSITMDGRRSTAYITTS